MEKVKENHKIIVLKWEGPFIINNIDKDKGKIKELMNEDDFGIYQIYGTHNIFGKNTLLYIGKAQENEFGARLSAHLNDWLRFEMDEIQIYIGKLVNIDNNKIKDDEWSELIDMAEKLLIRYCSPPYNSSGINKKFKIETEDNDKEASPDYILLNYNRKGVIPYEVSTLHDRLDLFVNNDYETLKYIQL